LPEKNVKILLYLVIYIVILSMSNLDERWVRNGRSRRIAVWGTNGLHLITELKKFGLGHNGYRYCLT
jgi:hypothetical protein